MKFFKYIQRPVGVSLFLAVAFVVFSTETNAQDRRRVVDDQEQLITQSERTRPTTRVPASPNSTRQTLTNEIVVRPRESPLSLVKRTSQSQLTTPLKTRTINATVKSSKRTYYNATARSMMYNSIQRKIGIRYRLGTQGPNLYDCSGFIWKVFQESGMNFTRTSARQFWQTFEPVSGDERFEFGTLVFFNQLGHVGIVADANGFYHASSSQGVTYSKFDGYWAKRIVGFRRVPTNNYGWDQPEITDTIEELEN